MSQPMPATPQEPVERWFAEMEPGRRVYCQGAWNLRGPGVYVHATPDRLTIGHRPGPFHYFLSVVFPSIALGVIWVVGREAWWAAAAVGLLFGVVPLLPLLNRQRYEVSPGELRAAGRALGVRGEKRWPLPPDAAVRVESVPTWDNAVCWTQFQAQIKVADGWVGVAELLHDPEPVRAFARQMAAAAGVPFLDEVSVLNRSH
jgi:hypothetical protein